MERDVSRFIESWRNKFTWNKSPSLPPLPSPTFTFISSSLFSSRSLSLSHRFASRNSLIFFWVLLISRSESEIRKLFFWVLRDQMEEGSVFRSLLAILQWWGFNVTVIIMNKWIFQVRSDLSLSRCDLILKSFNFWLQKLDFKFPLSVSCVHFICSSIGAYIVIKVLKLKPLIVVEPEDRWRRIFPMSFVFCINIVLGNVSLRYIPVSFMQTIKSFTPATTG